MDCFRLHLEHLAWIEHQFLCGIRVSRKAGSLWGMMRGVRGVRKTEHPSWLAKGLGFGLLCWDFKRAQEEIPSEKASALQIGSVAFPPVHNSILVTDYLNKMGIKTIPQPPYSPDLAPCDFCVFPKHKEKLRGCRRYETSEEMKEALTKVIDTLTQRELPSGLPEVVGMVQQVHCSQRNLLRRGLKFHVCTINKSAHTKKVLKLI